MREAAILRPWLGGPGAAAMSALVFAAYCRLHSLLEAVDTSVLASLRWGVLAGAPAGLLLWIVVWRWGGLADLVARGPKPAALLGLVLFLVLALGGSISHLAASGRIGLIDGAQLLDRSFDFVPVAAALSLLAIVALRRPTTETPGNVVPRLTEASSEWIELPEEPRLRLRRRDLTLVRSAGNYCEFHANSRVHLVRVPLKVAAERLALFGFVQAHRTSIVGLDHVCAIRPAADGRRLVRLSCGTEVQIGRAFREQFEDALADRSSHPGVARP